MREIKFRAYYKEQKVMEEPANFFILAADGHHSIDTDNVVLMQYTGLKDKNQKEIYEGDIVEFTQGDDEYLEVGWCRLKCRFQLINPICRSEVVDANLKLLSIGESYRVIGNIYENPELLNHE